MLIACHHIGVPTFNKQHDYHDCKQTTAINRTRIHATEYSTVPYIDIAHNTFSRQCAAWSRKTSAAVLLPGFLMYILLRAGGKAQLSTKPVGCS